MKNAIGCDEYQSLTRRSLFSEFGLGSLRALAPSWLPLVSFDEKGGKAKDVIISIYLRGGADGLSLCVPYGDEGYYRLRPNLAIKRPDDANFAQRVLDLDGYFGLPPAMAPLKELYDGGDLLFVHGAGSPNDTRSHFDAQHIMESASQDQKIWTGWLGRHLASSTPMKEGSLTRGMALAGTMPLTLEGVGAVQVMTDLNGMSLGGDGNTAADRQKAIESMYNEAESQLKGSVRNTLETMDALAKLNYQSYAAEGGATYIDDGFHQALKSAAALIKGDLGVEAIHIDSGGWDTHTYQNPTDPGYGMALLMNRLATGLAAFHKDLEPKGLNSKVTIVVMSEFGRQAGENSAMGTDHGHGNVMMLLGRNVAGKRVVREWPTLASDKLYDGRDLAVTIDYRDVLAEIVDKRLSNGANLKTIFPNYAPKVRGLLK